MIIKSILSKAYNFLVLNLCVMKIDSGIEYKFGAHYKYVIDDINYIVGAHIQLIELRSNNKPMCIV